MLARVVWMLDNLADASWLNRPAIFFSQVQDGRTWIIKMYHPWLARLIGMKLDWSKGWVVMDGHQNRACIQYRHYPKICNPSGSHVSQYQTITHHGCRCLQNPGELMVLPDYWWHATLNVGDTLALGGVRVRKVCSLVILLSCLFVICNFLQSFQSLLLVICSVAQSVWLFTTLPNSEIGRHNQQRYPHMSLDMYSTNNQDSGLYYTVQPRWCTMKSRWNRLRWRFHASAQT